MTKKVCRAPGCSEPAGDTRGACEKHAKRGGWATMKGSFQERYGISGGAWSTIRNRKIKAVGGKCWRCGKRYDASKLEVDHIGSKKDHRPINLRVLCKACHNIKTQRQATAARNRYHEKRRREKNAP